MEKTIEELKKENRWLRKALRNYGAHKSYCQTLRGTFLCTCGYKKLIEGRLRKRKLNKP